MSSKEKILSMLQESSFAYCANPTEVREKVVAAIETLAIDLGIVSDDIKRTKLVGMFKYYSEKLKREKKQLY